MDRFRQLPKLKTETKPDHLVLRRETPNNMSFVLPVEVKIAGERRRAKMINNAGSVPLQQDPRYEIDPNGSILMRLIDISAMKLIKRKVAKARSRKEFSVKMQFKDESINCPYSYL